MSFSSLKELRDEIRNQGDVLTIKMEELRDAYGAHRAGAQVRQNIALHLKNLGIAHRPSELPNDQERLVRLYMIDSPVGEVLSAAYRISPSGDRKLREVANGEAQTTLDRIRKLLK